MFIKTKGFLAGKKGLGTVEIVVIIAILVGIALIFRNYIIGFVKDLLGGVINSEVTNQLNSTRIQNSK